MKVSELFEAVQGSPGQGGTLQGGAYYKPKFTPSKSVAGLGDIRGSVKDWMDAIGASPQDIEKAVSRVKGSTLFRNEFPKAGLEYDARPAGEKNGTLSFKVNRKWTYGGQTRTARTGYNVYANGQIRCTSENMWGKEMMAPLKSPKPRVKAGDPVGSIVMIMTAAMEELLAKWNKASERMEREATKAAKQEVK
jgi:hypothetical protein